MTDTFYEGYHNGLESPALRGFAITKSDSTELPLTKALYIGTGGNLTVSMRGIDDQEADVVFANIQDGSLLPIRATKVKAATTASNIVGLA
jgi:hypothetical protein